MSLVHALGLPGNRLAGGLRHVTLPADAAHTLEVGTLAVGTIAGYTASRTITLPANAAVGDRCGIALTAGDDTYQANVTAASGDTLDGVAGGTTVCSVRQTGEAVIFRCTTAHSAWVVEVDTTRTYHKREVLTAARTYYVRTDGADTNLGLANTAAGAFLTIQKAINVVYGALDLGGYNVTIQVGNGTYTGGVIQSSPQVGAGTITLQGDTTTPANVVISPTSADAVLVQNYATLAIKGFKLQTTTSGFGLNAQKGVINFESMDFGVTVNSHLRSSDNAVLTATGNYAVTGGSQAHMNGVSGGVIRVQNRTVTITGTPALSTAFAYGQFGGTIFGNGNTYSGSATGRRYLSGENSVIQTGGGGANYFPGDAAGITETGGQYV